MYYLEKCAEEGCTRTGSVALKEGDKFCNIHSIKASRKEKEEKEEKEE